MFSQIYWKKCEKKLSSLASLVALTFISFYRAFLSGTLSCGGACRFYPSCSEYALLAYKEFSFFKATNLVIRRLLDCRPFGPKFRIEPDLSSSRSHNKNPHIQNPVNIRKIQSLEIKGRALNLDFGKAQQQN